MSNLKMVEAKLPAGFRFHPTDEELVCDYLMKKITRSEQPPILMEVDLNKSEPWDIPEYACVGGKEWYFYSQRDRKYATGLRTNRATDSGYWKATGKDRPVSRRNSLVGMRKTLVFYQGRAPKGKKTDWVMHEFRLEGPLGPPKLSSTKEEDWVLCRVFCKNKQVDQHHSLGSKQGMAGNGCYEIDTISSSSTYLPPLMDDPPPPPPPPPPLYNEYQTHHHQSSLYEQVPCFSIFNPMSINSSKFITKTTTNSWVPNNSFGDGMAPDQLINGNTCCEDKMVIDAVLNHLMDNIDINNIHQYPTNNMVKMMMKDSPCSFGEAASTSESFLSEVETIWNNY